MYGGNNLKPLLLTVVPNLDPSISNTLVTTVAGSPESGLTTTGPEPKVVIVISVSPRISRQLEILEYIHKMHEGKKICSK